MMWRHEWGIFRQLFLPAVVQIGEALELTPVVNVGGLQF